MTPFLAFATLLPKLSFITVLSNNAYMVFKQLRTQMGLVDCSESSLDTLAVWLVEKLKQIKRYSIPRIDKLKSRVNFHIHYKT